MKIYTGFLVLSVLCFSCPAFAQLVIKKNAPGKLKTALLIPESKIVSAASKIKKASLSIQFKKPAPATLNPFAQLAQAKANCPFLQTRKATLELDGERRTNESVNLEWKTIKGFNNLGFDVERSFDDTLHFERVNYVWAKNMAGIKDNYKLPDGNDYNKVSYYRLRLTLRSGETIYSNIAKVGGYTKEALLVYPNPSSGSLSLNVTANIDGVAAINIYDGTGRAVWQQSSFMNEGANVKTISLNNLAAGSYTVKIDMKDNTTKTSKFIKQ